jgi:hypothetical protein
VTQIAWKKLPPNLELSWFLAENLPSGYAVEMK